MTKELNLFKYATKELSQDAFLRWFLESDIDDSGKKLLSDFTGLDSNQISNIQTEAQVNKIDILVHFKFGNEECVLIIEDKIESDEHDNQLKRYFDIVKQQYKNAKHFFVYYKPRSLTDEEPKDEIKKDEWLGFGIKNIHGFFSKYLEHPNLILRSYALYIDEIYKKLSFSPELPIPEWDYLDALSFFENRIEKIFRKYHSGEKVSERKIYQGHYACNKIYFTFKNKKLYQKVYPLIEFIFRKNSDYVDLHAHICFRNNDVWTWKWQEETNDHSNDIEFVKRMRDVFIKSGFEKRGNLTNEKTQTFAVYQIFKQQDKQHFEQEIEDIIRFFVKNCEEFEKGF